MLKHFLDGKGFDLNMSGVRRAEGGVRSVKYKACFTQGAGSNKADDYRPIFWFTSDDRLTYESRFGIVHSRCYSDYGLERTGCVGCPFGKKFEAELYACERFEPNLAKAVKRIFRDSYEYTRRYVEFVDERGSGQMRLMI